MEMKKVLKYAMEIGEWMLKSGAGVSRVEDTISRICKAYGAKEANVFSITSSIVTTIEDEEGEIITQTKRIRYYKTDFKKLDELNQLSRYMCKYLPEEVIVSAVITAAWTSFYGGGITKDVIATLSGAFVAIIVLLFNIYIPKYIITSFMPLYKKKVFVMNTRKIKDLMKEKKYEYLSALQRNWHLRFS